MAPSFGGPSSSSFPASSSSGSIGSAFRPGQSSSRGWEALPEIAYGFVVYPLIPIKTSRRRSRLPPEANGGSSALSPNGLSTLREEPEVDQSLDDALEYQQSEQATLDIGDEIYAFEKLTPDVRNGTVWYRGYVVSTKHAPKVNFHSLESSFGLPMPSSSNAAPDDSITIGIFPASHVHIKETMPDAEGRLKEVYDRMVNGHSEPQHRPRTPAGGMMMETLREEPEDSASGSDRSSLGSRSRNPNGPRNPLTKSQSLSVPSDHHHHTPTTPLPRDPNEEKPIRPRPSMKSADDTSAARTQPLIDEIASALREWHPLMFKHLQSRDYQSFEVMKGHIEALHLGRRQLLTQSLSAEEMAHLRRDCVIRLVQGNVAQGLDIIVRHPTWGATVTVSSDYEADPLSWMSAPRMYALQASLAYVNQDPLAAITIPKSSALSPPSSSIPKNANSRLSIPPSGLRYPASINQRSSSVSTPTSTNPATDSSPSAAFFHIYFELKAFVASPCAPGETAELYFSLYNSRTEQFVTEDFCAILNHNGVSARDPEGRYGPVRTFFRDLGERDIQDDIYLVCRIVRNGAMKMLGPSSVAGGGTGTINGSTMNGTLRRGSEPLYRVSELGDLSAGDITIGNATSASHNTKPVASNSRGSGVDWTPSMYRRPFGAGVASLETLKVFADGRDATDLAEYSLPIFVPTNEATFSVLHQNLIGSNTKEFEESPRAQRIAVVIKAFHGDASTIVKENPSLLQDVPMTARLGFPDVVFPGDTRNELYVKLWSGEFFYNPGGAPRILSRASFSGPSGGLCNVQVSLEVRTRAGAVVEDVVSAGNGEPLTSRHHSMIFYRNNSPTFGELVKFVIPVEMMPQCHLFFTFRHRSAKEKGDIATSDKPFAFAYLPLFPDGHAFHSDGGHTLVLYRADRSPWTSAEEYFGAPPTITEGQRAESLPIPANLQRTAVPMRDTLTIRSLLCSTKYTQDPVLLSLLSWDHLPDKKAELTQVLSQFKQVPAVEIVKFLRDIFDSLFAILVSSTNDGGELDDAVFNALVIVLGIVSDRRFKNFQPVLDVYIAKHFSCAPASSQIVRSLNRLLQNLGDPKVLPVLRDSFKVWHYIMRFVVRAREMQKAKEVGMGTTSEHLDSAFKKDLSTQLELVNRLMLTKTPSSIIGTQTIALQQFPTIFPDLSQVFSPLELVEIVTSLSNALNQAKGKMVIWKLITYLQIVRSSLFDDGEARALLVETLVEWLKPHLGRYDEFRHTQLDDTESAKDNARIGWLETLRLSITIMAIVLDRLQTVLIDPAVMTDRKAHSREEANVEFLLTLLPRVVETYAEFQMPANLKAIERTRSTATTPSACPISFPTSYPFTLVANGTTTSKTIVNGVVHEIPDLFNCGLGETALVFLTMILASSARDLNKFFEFTFEIEGAANLTRGLASMLTISTSILNNDAFSDKWLNVNVLAHATLLKLAEPIGSMMVRNYIPSSDADEFDADMWFDYLHMLLKLLSSEQIVIEDFSPQKRRAVWKLAGDVRGVGAALLLRCWDALGSQDSVDHEGNLLARYGGFQGSLLNLVDLVLTLCLSHHDQLRTNAVQIVYSMVLSEYQATGNFDKIKTEVINKLDALFVSENEADDVSRSFFVQQLRHCFEASTVDEALRTRMLEFLGSVDMFLDLLISVRELPNGDEFLDDKVIATLRLMNFTREIGRDEMYIRYVHMLANVHIKSGHYVEAALTLKLHADLHDWDLMTFVDPLPDLGLPRQSSFVRKETLSLLILDYYGKGGAWENAVEMCQELAAQHMETTFNYQRLSEILSHQAALLQRIVSDQRVYPSYFLVTFYGEFPQALRRQPFVYRAYDWEKYNDFCDRMLQKHPNAELLQDDDEVTDPIRFGVQPYIHCVSVDPLPDKTSHIFTNINVPPQIRTYYEHNDVNRFTATRSIVRGYHANGAPEVWVQKTTYHTEQLFPTVLRRSEVIDIETEVLSPVESALVDVEEKTKELSQMHLKFDILAKIDSVSSTNALTMALNEIVDAPPDAGITLYRDNFLHNEYIQRTPSQEENVHKLRAAVDNLTILVDQCLKLHGTICPEEMLPFHSTLESFFRRNFQEEIVRLELDMTSSHPRRSALSARELPTSPHSVGSSSITGGDGKRMSAAMALGRGGPSLYVNSQQFSPMYGNGGAAAIATPTSPHALHFDVNGAIVQRGMGAANGDVHQHQPPTPLQRNLAHLARSGIPGMSHALIASSSAGGASSSFVGGGLPMNGNGSSTADGSDIGRRPSRAPLATRGESPVLVNKPSMASFSTLMSPSGGGGGRKGPYQSSTISRNASVANSIGGRLSRFGSILRKGDR